APAQTSSLSLHDALPICRSQSRSRVDGLSGIDAVVSVSVHPLDQVSNLELIGAVAPSSPLIGNDERSRGVRDLELILERGARERSEEHTSELKSRFERVC